MRVLHLDRMMQLAAELADEVDAQRMQAAGPTEIGLPDEPGEGGVGEVGVGELLQHLARARAGEDEHAAARSSPARSARCRPSGRSFLQDVVVVALQRAGGDEIEDAGRRRDRR